MSNGNGHRWSKFWWQDWQREIALKLCCMAARGLWMEMLCLAHEGEPVGHVTVNGKAPTDRQLATMVGASEKEVSRLIKELESNGVFSRTPDGIIYCRRMVRDAGTSQSGAEHVRKKWGEGEEQGKSRSSRLSAARRKGTHTPEEWQAMLDVIGPTCLRCDRPAGDNGSGLVKDHIVPVYQGGSDGIENIQPLCRSCNAAKGPDTTDHRPEGWRKRLGQRLGECLGVDQMMPRSTPSPQGVKRLLEADTDSDSEAEERKGSKYINLLSYSSEIPGACARKDAPISQPQSPAEPMAHPMAVANVVAKVVNARRHVEYGSAWQPIADETYREAAQTFLRPRPGALPLVGDALKASRRSAGMIR